MNSFVNVIMLLLLAGCCVDIDTIRSENRALIQKNGRLRSEIKNKIVREEDSMLSANTNKKVLVKNNKDLEEEYRKLSKQNFDFDKRFISPKKLAQTWCNNIKIGNRAVSDCLKYIGYNGQDWIGSPLALSECIKKAEYEMGIEEIDFGPLSPGEEKFLRAVEESQHQ
jgi:hypothetical protein